MKIVNLNNAPVRAAFQMEHKGLLISTSSIMSLHGSCENVVVFLGDYEVFTVNTIPEAIYAIDEKLKGYPDLVTSTDYEVIAKKFFDL